MRTYEAAPKYDAKIVYGNFSVKTRKEYRIIDVAGKYSLIESTSENENRLVSFVQMYDLIILSSKFKHKKIHKETFFYPCIALRWNIIIIIIIIILFFMQGIYTYIPETNHVSRE